jgi:23S rRNA (cytidine1920-2'-O)/16S rRNA (cytidine1409-2'-O)-methyltransferase
VTAPPAHKQRIDRLLVERGLAPTRQRARALIMAGQVRLDGRLVDKPGTACTAQQRLEITGQDLPYVSRGGLKLEAALRELGIDVRDRVCLDAGASTGGFTDCLLQHGARRVWAVDVGYGQLAWKLRQDPRVTVLERTNVRWLTRAQVPEPIDLVTIDLSFISLRLVLPALLALLRPGGRIVALVKPQFEVGRGLVGKGGIVRDAALHQQVLGELRALAEAGGLVHEGTLPSPITGAKGNREFLMVLRQCSI